jgi:hypothetical protein
MKITLEKTENNVKLLKLMADTKNLSKAMEAREAFAAFITTPILNIIQSEPVIGNLFTTWTYDYGTPPSIPLAPLFDVKTNSFIRVWAQSRPGGLATSTNSDVSELMVMTYALEGAVAFPLNYLRAARVDVVAAYLQRLAQEFLYKQEANSVAVLAAVAAQSTFLKNGTSTTQVYRTVTQGSVIPQDISKLVTLMSRVNSSWVGGTPAQGARAITTLIGSPEFMEQIRNMAFEPLNTRANTYPLGGPAAFRDNIYNAGGNPSIYGMELIAVYDMGTSGGIPFPYNNVFSVYAGTTTYPGYNAGSAVQFSPGSEQVVFGIDRRQDFLARLVESNPDDGSTLSIQSDNQFSVRAESIGFYARIREGRVALDGRNTVALVF